MVTSKKIKVAEVITRMDWAGSADIFRILCERLDKEIYDVRPIIGYTRYPTPKTEAFLKAFAGRLVSIPALRRDVRLCDDIRALIGLFRLFRQERFDIVHTHTAKAGALARLAAHWARVPVIIHTPHGHNFYGYFNWPASRIVVLIERWLARFTSRIMVLTELEKSDHLHYRVGRQAQLVHINTGLELDMPDSAAGCAGGIRKRFGIPESDKLVGFVGRLEPVKGPGYLLAAARTLLGARNDTSFLFVGEGALHAKLQRQAEAWNIDRKVFFTGWQNDSAQIMAGLDILAVPSLNEAVGLVILEAQAQGIAVVATNVGGIPEMVQDQKTALLVPAHQSQALADALAGLLDDPHKRKTLGDAARIWIRDRFDPALFVNSVAALYQGALRQGHEAS